MNNEAEEFWTKREEELGTKILSYALVTYFDKEIQSLQFGKDSQGQWGLCYFTKEQLYFQHFAQKTWIGSLLNNANEDKEVLFSLSLLYVQSWRAPQHGNVFSRLLGKTDPRLIITMQNGQQYYFRMDIRDKSFMNAWNAVLSDKELT